MKMRKMGEMSANRPKTRPKVRTISAKETRAILSIAVRKYKKIIEALAR